MIQLGWSEPTTDRPYQQGHLHGERHSQIERKKDKGHICPNALLDGSTARDLARTGFGRLRGAEDGGGTFFLQYQIKDHKIATHLVADAGLKDLVAELGRELEAADGALVDLATSGRCDALKSAGTPGDCRVMT